MKTESDIHYFLKICNFLGWILGVQKSKIQSHMIVETGYFYRVYVIVLTTFLAIPTIHKMVVATFLNLPYLTYKLEYIIILNDIGVILLSFTIIISAIQNILTSSSTSCKIFKLYVEIEKYLGPLGNNFRRSLLFYHGMYLIIKILFVLYELFMWEFSNTSIIIRHLMVTIMEIEVFHYAMKIIIVARYFETINALVNMCENQNIYVGDSILLRIWKKNESMKFKNKFNPINLMVMVEKLTEVVDKIHSCYRVKVIFFFILKYSIAD